MHENAPPDCAALVSFRRAMPFEKLGACGFNFSDYCSNLKQLPPEVNRRRDERQNDQQRSEAVSHALILSQYFRNVVD